MVAPASRQCLLCRCRKKLSHAEKQRVWSRSRGLQDLLQYSDCALSCAMWLLQTKEQLSRLAFSPPWVGSVAASLSAAHVRKMWRTAKKGDLLDMVRLRNPFPPFLFRIPSIHSLPEAGSESWQYVPPPLHFGCIMPIPSLQLKKKTCCMQGSRGLGQGVLVSKICYNAVIVLSAVLCDCCNQWTIVEIELLATVGWKCGCQPFSCLCLKNVTRSRKEIYATCLSKESIPASTFGNCKHPVSTRSFRFLRAAARSTSSALCLHHGHPFVAASEQSTCLMQRSKVTTKICYIQYCD